MSLRFIEAVGNCRKLTDPVLHCSQHGSYGSLHVGTIPAGRCTHEVKQPSQRVAVGALLKLPIGRLLSPAEP